MLTVVIFTPIIAWADLAVLCSKNETTLIKVKLSSEMNSKNSNTETN
jgi:hypothetical protein